MKLSKDLRYYIAVGSALIHGFFAAYGFWSLNRSQNIYLNIFIASLGILLGCVTFIGMADHWEVFKSQEEDEEKEWFEATLKSTSSTHTSGEE